MTTLCTSLRVAAVLLTAACSTTPLLAQSVTRKATPVKHTTAARPALASTVASTPQPNPVQATAAPASIQTAAVPAQQHTAQPAVAHTATSRTATATHPLKPSALRLGFTAKF